MTENEIIDYLQLDLLARKIELQASNIQKSELGYQLAYLEYFPFFDIKGAAAAHKEELRKYYELLTKAFYNICKIINETSEPTILEAVNYSVEYLHRVLADRDFIVQLLPLAQILSSLYNSAHTKLIKAGLEENAKHLEELRRRIFLSWSIIG